ncbi:cadherin repeat domain-containing protein, partial [Brevundimonas sp.]|uniref:cadherin repeat domain-containing protein n=1 Tax=Brevundimonas sp. TaxID=1871086 RepID=UPI00391983BC
MTDAQPVAVRRVALATGSFVPGDFTVCYQRAGRSAADVFRLNANTRQLFVQQAVLDYESVSEYSLVVRATDGGGLWHEATSTVAVLDVNERPTLYGAWYEVEENSPEGTRVGAPLVATDPDFGQTLTYSITGGDGASVFSIEDGTGQLRVAQAVLDFETKSSYSVVVRATDNGQPAPLW